jgi:hypothetical protein
MALDAAGIGYEDIDITRDPGLEAEYRLVIPVVEVGGRPVHEAGMDPRDIPRLVRKAAKGRRP